MSLTLASPTTFIRKRDGRLERFDPLKLENHLRLMSWGLDSTFVNIQEIVRNLSVRLPANTIGSEAFLIFTADIVSSFASRHPDYSILAGRVYTCYHHKRVPKRFSAWVLSHENATPSVFTTDVVATVRNHADVLDAAIMHQRDFDFTYRAMQMFERSYLLKDGRQLIERLQFLFMRVSVGIHGDNIEDVLETYRLLSTRKISFASPILWNGGLANRHYASCYIYEPFAVTADDAVCSFSSLSTLWSSDGGVGINAGRVPGTRRGGDGTHPGLMPLLRVYESIAAYWSKSNHHRSSSAAVYLPIWHCDVRRFVQSRTNRASTGYRFRHLFPALWIPNIFMRRLEANGIWSLFDPALVGDLNDMYGDAFEVAYESYELQGLAVSTVSAKGLWDLISDAVRETGAPFMMYSDNVNARNNQMNLGIVKASNLCTEIVQFSSPMETAVCTLASLCLPRYLRADGTFDFGQLHAAAKLVVRSLDRLIDIASYSTGDAAVSAYRTRSIGIGSQGLADVFALLEYPFVSSEARALNKRLSETIYHASLESSTELAEVLGTYETWADSPARQGILQVDMWAAETSDHYDFANLRDRIRHFGLRNSVLTAQMPTTSTAQLFGNSEGVDPFISNILQFRVLSGTYNEVSRPLVNALTKRGLWTERIRTEILAAHGSVQAVPGIPEDLKSVFRTAFELNQHDLVDMAADRGPFIDQSQSLTLFVADPTSSTLMELQLHAWRSGLKTGAYYVRSKPAIDPLPVGVGKTSQKATSSVASSSSLSAYVDTLTCPCDT